MKKWNRQWKLHQIEKINPDGDDLFDIVFLIENFRDWAPAFAGENMTR